MRAIALLILLASLAGCAHRMASWSPRGPREGAVRLLIEAHKDHREDALLRGEYRITLPHIQISCPECGGSAKNIFYLSVFEEKEFHCRHCDFYGAVKLTGARGDLGK